MKLAKILCPTDFSAGAKQAVQVATMLAKQTKAELVIAHAWHIPAVSVEGAYGFGRPEDQARDAQQELDKVASDIDGAKCRLLHGTPWEEIVSLVENEKFDLCVIGTQGRTGIARVLLGSVAEKVVRHAPCSVLAVRADGKPKPFEHALVPTDFSDSARHALAYAGTVIPADGVITLLHVLEVPSSYGGGLPDKAGRELDERVTKQLEREASHVKSKARVETTYRVGYPGAEMLHAIDRDKTVDLVVMGSHGRSGIREAVVGSVAEKTVRHARCPVLVTRR
jgi:nucleotide-binding universal stress UspA family protein